MGKFSYRGIETADSFSFLSTDNLSDFIKTIKTFPKRTNEENIELLKMYREGDLEALSELIKGNISVIIHKAKAFSKNNASYQLLDLINEAVIVFIEAADTYDLENQPAKLTTYFMNGADFKLVHVLRTKDHLIRRSTTLSKQVLEYNRLYEEYEAAGKEPPTDEEVKSRLGINDSRLKTIRNDYKYHASSLDARVDDNDDESTEYSNFISNGINESDNIVNKITNKELFIFLKKHLTDYQYYVILMRTFGNQTFNQIASVFKVSESAIRQTEKKAHELIKEYCSKDGSIDYELDRTISVTDMEIRRCAPIHPYDITKYMFFREVLVENERKLFKLYIKGDYIPDDEILASILQLDIAEYQRLKASLFRKITNMTPELEEIYDCFREAIIKTYGSKIYTIDWDMDLENIRANAKYISKLWEDKTYTEVLEIFKKNNITVTHTMDHLLRKYFNCNTNKPTYGDLRKAERDINHALFGFKKKKEIPLENLYKTAVNHKEYFTEEQYDYLMMKLFNRIGKKAFIKKYPNSPLLNGGGFYVITRLEELYFDTANYKELNFTRKKYLQVRDICLTTLSKEYMQILDRYYGFNCSKETVYDIQKGFNFTYEQARDKLAKAKSSAQSIYLNRSNKKIIDSEYYIPYVLNENIDLNPLHRSLLKGYLIQGKSYDELSKEFYVIDKKGNKKYLTKHEVSSNMLDALMKIDFYRFNILRKYSYPKNISQRAIGSSKFSTEERKILQDLVSGVPRSEIEAKYQVDSKYLENLYNRHSQLCHKYAVENVKVTIKDVEWALNIHKAANVLNDNERIVLAFTYGVKCDINPHGTFIEQKDFKSYYPNISSRYSKILNNAIDTIAGAKIGIDHATLDIINPKDLKRSLLDPRLPISEKERELLCYTYELFSHKYKDLNELAGMYGERATSIKRRIQRAIVTINRYENNEIQAVISYEYDVLPNLKYFTKNDRTILEYVYKDNLTYNEISKRTNLTEAQVEKLVKRLMSYLRDILDDDIKPFDFDYYYQNIDNKDLPFYDNIEIAKKMFDLYFEKRLTIKEIQEVMDLDLSNSTIQRIISSLMTAINKRKEGIKKVNGYTYDDVKRYYRTHNENMDRETEASYFRYFNRVEKLLNGTSNREIIKEIPINPTIILDLIKDNNENAFTFDITRREYVIELIKSHRKELSNETIDTICSFYGIREREFMSNKEISKVFKLLATIKLGEFSLPSLPDSNPLLTLSSIDN